MSSYKLALDGQIIDERFQIIGTLAEVGFGSVYLAKQLGFDRNVAIKFLHHHLINESDSLARFEREAKTLSSLNHKNIVACYAYGTWRNRLPYAVFELVNGMTLKQRLLVEYQIPWQEAFSIGIDVCGALSAAHGAGIVHRDLKPENIMIANDSSVKVLDFGLAHIDGQQLTQTGALVGSLMYMSPEQASGKIAVPQSDIYSLACVLYEAICGQPPLLSDNPIGLLHKHRTEYPARLSDSVKDLPDCVDDILAGAMTKDCKERYADAMTFAQALRKALDGSFPSGNARAQRPPQLRKTPQARSKQTQTIVASIALIGILALLLANNLHQLILYAISLDKASNQAKDLENCGDWLTRINGNETAQLLYKAALDDPDTNALNRIRRLDKLATALEKGTTRQQQQLDKTVQQSMEALSALPDGLLLSEEDANVLAAAVVTDERVVRLSRTMRDRRYGVWAAAHIEALLLKNSRFVQWISVAEANPKLTDSDLITHADTAIERTMTLQNRQRRDLVDTFIDRQLRLVDQKSIRLGSRLDGQYKDLLEQLKSGHSAQQKTTTPILTRVVPWISKLTKSDRQRLLTLLCAASADSHRFNELAALEPLVGSDYESGNNDPYHQSAILIHACSLSKSGKNALAFDSCCQLAPKAQGTMRKNCIELALATIPPGQDSSPSASEKFKRLAMLVRNDNADESYRRIDELLINSLRLQKKMPEAIAELRDLITRLPKRPSSESKWFYYYSYLEDFLSHEKMPAENSIEKQVIPRVLSLSSAERMDFMKAIGANGVAADRWVDIALLDSLNGKDYQTSKDSNYRQSMMFIRACSLYVAGRSNQAYDLCCQLIKTAAPPLLDRCIRLSLLTVSGSEPTNDAKITQRRTFLKNLIETRRTAKKFLTVL